MRCNHFRCSTLFVSLNIILTSILFATEVRAEGEFTPLGDLANGSFDSKAYGVSGDGSVVVGYGTSASGTEAFSWTSGGGMVGLGDLPLGSFRSIAFGVSGDGLVVVGQGYSSQGWEAFRWENGTMTALGDLPGGGFQSNAMATNSDGSVVVGYSDGGSVQAIRWTSASGMVSLGDLPGGVTQSWAYGVNGDGSVVVGAGTSASGREAFRWTSNGGMVGLGDLTGGSYESWSYSVNNDGSVVVGYGTSANGKEAFRWENDTMTGLGDFSGGTFESLAYNVNSDGSVVVGYGTTASGQEAFRWTETDGMVRIVDWLDANGVSVAPGYTLQSARDVSDDGSIVVGYGTGSSGEEAWIARADSGVLSMDSDLTQSLAETGMPHQDIASTIGMIFNGAHHRSLMDSAMPGDGTCAWINGDLGRLEYNDHDGHGYLGEAGFCGRSSSQTLMVGVGLGRSGTDEDTAFSGHSETDGKYLLGEIDYRPGGNSLLYSFTALIGAWDTDIRRGYMNAGLKDSSTGTPDIDGASLRARVDWLYVWGLGDITFTPRAQFSLSYTHMDAYTETGGGFPAHFDERSHTAKEVRLGVRSDKHLSNSATLHADVEAVHRFDDSGPNTHGQIVGLFDFDLPGADLEQDWIRLGLEVDQSIGKNQTLSASLHASSEGQDPSISGAVSFKIAF